MEVVVGKRLFVSVVIELSATDVTLSYPAEQADDDDSSGEHSGNPGFGAITN
jgi:hypothetical protein